MTMTCSMCCLARSSWDCGAVVAGDAGIAAPARGPSPPAGSSEECAQAAASAKQTMSEASHRNDGFISSRSRDGRLAGRRMGVEDQRRKWVLGEVELAPQVAQQLHVLPHDRSGVRPPVGLRIQALTTHEQVLDELEICVE